MTNPAQRSSLCAFLLHEPIHSLYCYLQSKLCPRDFWKPKVIKDERGEMSLYHTVQVMIVRITAGLNRGMTWAGADL